MKYKPKDAVLKIQKTVKVPEVIAPNRRVISKKIRYKTPPAISAEFVTITAGGSDSLQVYDTQKKILKNFNQSAAIFDQINFS